MIASHDPKIIFIQETNMESFNPRIINTIWKAVNVDWLFTPSIRNSSGLLSMWRTDFFTIESHKVERNWIAMDGHIPSLNFRGCIINVYNPCMREDRAEIWNIMAEFQVAIKSPCLLLGDFSEVLDPSERGSSQVSQ